MNSEITILSPLTLQLDISQRIIMLNDLEDSTTCRQDRIIDLARVPTSPIERNPLLSNAEKGATPRFKGSVSH